MAKIVDEFDATSTEGLSEIAEQNQVPIGYIPVELSTKGYFGAPPLFHIRNFSTTDLFNLGLADDDDYIERLVESLQSIVYEKDVDVGRFHEKEIDETLLKLYTSFYTKVMPNMPYPIDDKDKEYLATIYGGVDTDAYRQRIRMLERGEEKPVFDLDISNIKFKEAKKSNKALIKKGPNTSYKLGYPAFGDTLLLKKFIATKFKEQDKSFASAIETVKTRRDAKEKLLDGQDISMRGIPDITPDERNKLKAYERDRALFTIAGSIAMYLLEVNGESVAHLPLEQRIDIVNSNPSMFDFSTFKKYSDNFKKFIEPGPVDEIECYSPIQQRRVKKVYSFRLLEIITAIRDADSTATIDFIE